VKPDEFAVKNNQSARNTTKEHYDGEYDEPHHHFAGADLYRRV
jgi:hypothetical protein